MITIMTPTYNRAYILGNAYQSLQKQTSFDFEWIIIDDGSADNTEELVKGWIAEETRFSIIYEKQPNGGKHRAVNRGVALASYEYFLILDSDDTLTEDAVAKVHHWITQIDGLDGFAGVAGLRSFPNPPQSKSMADAVIGGMPSQPYIDATNLERGKYGLLGDKVEVYKTDVLKRYPFPEFEGENFLSEMASWDRIARDGLKIRWYSDVIYLCEYIEDGLTKNIDLKAYARNFQGYTYCSKLLLETRFGWLRIYRCGEFAHVASLNGLSFVQAKRLLGASWSMMIRGVILFYIRKLYHKVCK